MRYKNEFFCEKCNRDKGMCICDLSLYTNIGDVSAVGFMDEHVEYYEGAGSPFYQGWAYKHNQMKFKLNEKDEVIQQIEAKLQKAIEIQQEFMWRLEFYQDGLKHLDNYIVWDIQPTSNFHKRLKTDKDFLKLARQTLEELKENL